MTVIRCTRCFCILLTASLNYHPLQVLYRLATGRGPVLSGTWTVLANEARLGATSNVLDHSNRLHEIHNLCGDCGSRRCRRIDINVSLSRWAIRVRRRTSHVRPHCFSLQNTIT